MEKTSNKLRRFFSRFSKFSRWKIVKKVECRECPVWQYRPVVEIRRGRQVLGVYRAKQYYTDSIEALAESHLLIERAESDLARFIKNRKEAFRSWREIFRVPVGLALWVNHPIWRTVVTLALLKYHKSWCKLKYSTNRDGLPELEFNIRQICPISWEHVTVYTVTVSSEDTSEDISRKFLKAARHTGLPVRPDTIPEGKTFSGFEIVVPS